MAELVPLIPLDNGLRCVPNLARAFILHFGMHVAPEFLQEGETEEQAIARVQALYRNT